MSAARANTDTLKTSVVKEVDAQEARLRRLALDIHAKPEVAFHEEKACAWLADYLQENGFAVDRGICGLSTSFKAAYGRGKPTIALVGEYDALPVIGHGCGHNLIGTAAAGAGVAVRKALDKLGGTVVVIGTPAEEVYGGKCYMVERGAFDNLDAAMMIHPGISNAVNVLDTNPGSLAAWPIDIQYYGKSSHASAKPEEGVNALDAMILAFSGINAMRQQIQSTARIHGIITDGGQAINAIPAHTAASFLVRAETRRYLEELKERVANCFEAAALATGARLEYKWGEGYYLPVLNNLALARVFKPNLESLGREVKAKRNENPTAGRASSDFGNVSQIVAATSAMISIADPGTQGHSPEMAAAAASDAGIQGMLDGAKALAMTAIDLLSNPQALSEIAKEFQAAQKS